MRLRHYHHCNVFCKEGNAHGHTITKTAQDPPSAHLCAKGLASQNSQSYYAIPAYHLNYQKHEQYMIGHATKHTTTSNASLPRRKGRGSQHLRLKGNN